MEMIVCPNCDSQTVKANRCSSCGRSLIGETAAIIKSEQGASGSATAEITAAVKPSEWLMRSAIAGGIAAFIGGLLWYGIDVGLDLQSGWIAWGIGALVGFAISIANRGSGTELSGYLAAGLAVLGIFWGKSLTIDYYRDLIAIERAKITDELVLEAAIAECAWEAQYELEGQKSLSFMDVLGALSDDEGDDGMSEWISVPTEFKSQFSTEAWEEALFMWNDLDPEEQAESVSYQREDLVYWLDYLDEYMEEEIFVFFDLVWYVLAIASAYKIASNDRGRRVS